MDPTIQARTLAFVLQHLENHFSTRNKRPVVEIDVDMCAFTPRFRTWRAARQTGEAFGIVELAQIGRHDLLPGYTEFSWMQFVDRFNLSQRYPQLRWGEGRNVDKTAGSPYSFFHSKFWSTELLIEDHLTPGLVNFVKKVERIGGAVVFISGRWLHEQVEPTLAVLRRGGIDSPNLSIGNDRHITIVGQGAALSDADAKAAMQKAINARHGEPAVIIDDRKANQEAIAAVIPWETIGVSIALPGFTFDPSVNKDSLRLCSFEDFSSTLRTVHDRPYLIQKYGNIGIGQNWNGMYEGRGKNRRPYIIPKPAIATGSGGAPRFREIRARIGRQRISESELLDLCFEVIPRDARNSIIHTMVAAKAAAERRIAEGFPRTREAEDQLRRSLIACWIHSLDIECVMRYMGYPSEAGGRHDLYEFVAGSEIIALLQRLEDPARVKRPSAWLLNWGRTLTNSDQVNVGMLNPSLTVSFWQWRPDQDGEQEAMDVHRLSDHHDGDANDRYDPIEATINNLLHQREGVHGVRHEPVVEWEELEQILARETGAEGLSKSSIGSGIIRDALEASRLLEKIGATTPWDLVAP